MSFNLCDLPPEQKELIEVDKTAAYVAWLEREGKFEEAAKQAAAIKPHHQQAYQQSLAKYQRR